MMKINPIRIVATATAVISLSATAFAQDEAVTAQSIIEGIEKQKAEALSAYLDANPDAKDRELAVSVLIQSHALLGNQEAIIPLLESRYASMEKGPSANLQELIGGVFVPLFQTYLQTGKPEKAEALIENLRTDLAAHPAATQIGGFLEQMKAQLATPQVGETLEIAFTSLGGEEIDLAKMAGKVVLVDFWATWCAPCIAEIPNLLAAHEKYSETGFEVIAISLDDNKDELTSYITENSLPWPQSFDGKGMQSDLAVKYGITGIPATFLIGKDGKIAATNLRGPALEKAIETALAVN